MDTEIIAKAIKQANTGKQSYIARITTGEHKGKYVGYNLEPVKTRSSACQLVVNKVSSFERMIYQGYLPVELEIIALQK